MKHIFLISLLGVFVSVSAMGAVPTGGGAAGPVPGGAGEVEPAAPEEPELPEPCAYVPTQVGDRFPVFPISCNTGDYITSVGCTTCLEGYYCPGVDNYCYFASGDVGINECPSNYDNTAAGLTSIEECCLNGYDSNTGLCIESSDPTPSRAPGRIDRNETNPVCDDTTLGTASGTTDFEADWIPNEISITWDDNGATTESTGGVDKCTYDQSFTLPTPPTRTGYTFDGWKVVNK